MPLAPIAMSHAIGGQLVRFAHTAVPVPVLTAPGAPSAVTTSSLTSSSVTLSWGSPASTGGSPVTGYVVSRDGAGGTSTTVGAAVLSQQFRSLAASTTYHLSVAAVNAAGTGPATTVTVTTPAGAQPAGGMRFPGDPNPLVNSGTLYFGTSVQNNGDPASLEAGTGVSVGDRHRYWNTVSALSVPSGPMAQAVLDDHAHNRLPLVSWYIGPANWAGGANGSLDATIDAWIAWCEQQAKPVYWIVTHEPENDANGVPADFRAWMSHIRSRITAWEAVNGPRKRLAFCGCLMAFTFTGGNGGTAAWWPGDGVWDVLGVDIYVDLASVPTPPSTTILNNAWSKTEAFAKAHHIPIFVTEYGVRPENPNGAAIMQEFFDHCTSGTVDVIGLSYFDSGWWVLGDNNGMLSKFRALLTNPKSVRMSTLGY